MKKKSVKQQRDTTAKAMTSHHGFSYFKTCAAHLHLSEFTDP
jgi:hypothetical protein